MDKDGVEKLYFVIETKGTTRLDGLRGDEEAKFNCGRKHFAALGDEVCFPEKPVRDWKEYKLSV